MSTKETANTTKWFLSVAKVRGLLSEARAWLREQFYRSLLGQTNFRCRELPCISVRGNFSATHASVLMKQSLERAVANIGGPPDFVRAIDGMSGQKYRTFINNFVGAHSNPQYLEIGTWQGSTAASALYGNSVKALCIDNWSQFGGPKSEFLANMERIRSESPAVEFRFIENDFRQVDYCSLGRFNIYLFDGPHEESDQYDGIVIVRPALQKSFVLIVDDWNWRQVRIGTFRAIRDAKYSITCSIEIRTTQDNSVPQVTGKDSDWHNGYFIADLVGR